MKIKMTKIDFNLYTDEDMQLIRKIHKKLKIGKIKKAKSLIKDFDMDQIAKDFIKCNAPSKMDLNFIEKFIKVCKLLYSNDKRPMKDKLYDPMVTKFKQYRDEPISDIIVGKRTVEVEHTYPEIKGNIDKANVLKNKDIAKSLDVSVEAFIETLFKANKGKTIDLRLSKKADGCSVIGEIKGDHGKQYLTRGEDDKGADLTHIFKDVTFVNKDKCGVAFEGVMTKDNYEKYCSVRGRTFASLRSAVVSVFTASDAARYSKYITLIPLRTSLDIPPAEMNYKFASDIEYEYKEIKCVSVKDAIKQIKEYTNQVLLERPEMEYAIDGVVITCTNKKVVEKLGRKGNSNKYEIAYKFPAEQKLSYVNNIDITVGRTGLVTPIVIYNNVTFNGGNHDHSTLSSFSRYKKMGLRYNEEISLTNNNDVMPYVNKLEMSNHNNKLKTDIIPFPTHCKCGYELRLDGANYYCDNPLCDDKLIASYDHFYKTFGVSDIATKKLIKLKDNGLIKSFKDLIKLDYKSIIEVEGFETKSIKSLKKQIDFIYNNPVDEAKLATALGIAGEKTCRTILSTITLDKILSNPELLYDKKIAGIEKLKKESFIKKSIMMLDIIKYFYEELAVVPCVVNNDMIKICFSGFRDTKLKIILENLGMEVVDNVTKDTKYVVIKHLDDNGNITETGKTEKAKKYAKYGCQIITLAELNDIMKEII